jgi:hypothetical protein
MKACHQSTCMNPVFSHGYCTNHQYLRTDSKYIDKQKDKRLRQYYPIKKIVRDIDFEFRNELDMFNQIWDIRPHKCEFTGESLDQFYGTDLWYSCFLHVLPKGRFPLFKLNAENVRLGFPDFHWIVDKGTKADRLDHPTWDFTFWDELVQEMKEKYIKFKKDNLLA